MNEKRVKMLSSLAHAKYRKVHRLFLVEGAHAVSGLLASSWPVEMILTSDSFDFNSLGRVNVRGDIIKVGQKTIDRISTTKTPQDVIAVAAIPDTDVAKSLAHDKILIADGVKDPGNLGTIIRTAEAFGFGSIVTTPGSADIFNPKVVRSTQGTLFAMDSARHIPVPRIHAGLRKSHDIYALSSAGETDLSEVESKGKFALVIGAEIDGVSDQFLNAANSRIRIPIVGNAESLNAAMAAGIAMYVLSQRS